MKKIKVVSLFSGGGGLDLGFTQAGYNIIWAIDNEKNAVETYKYNIGNHILCNDINQINVSDIPSCDVVIGGPPCQSFSLAGNRNSDDDRGKLVWKYIDIIKSIRPRAFLFENVTGLLSAKNKKGEQIYPQLVDAFRNIGYSINAKVINAADYGVPQIRKRVIIVGFEGNNIFLFPERTHSKDNYITVFEALSDLPNTTNEDDKVIPYDTDSTNQYQSSMRNNGSGVTEHIVPTMSELDRYVIAHVKPGGNYMDIPTDVSSKRIQRLQKTGGHTTCYGRMHPNKPSYTINTYFNRPNVGCNIHYKENRLITVREALRLQSFPDTYQLISTSKQGKNLIVGNAVPPKVAFALATQLKSYFNNGGNTNVDIV